MSDVPRKVQVKEKNHRKDLSFFRFFGLQLNRHKNFRRNCVYDDESDVRLCTDDIWESDFPIAEESASVPRLTYSKPCSSHRIMGARGRLPSSEISAELFRDAARPWNAPTCMPRNSLKGALMATEEPTKNDCYGNMVDGRFCHSEQPSISLEPTDLSQAPFQAHQRPTSGKEEHHSERPSTQGSSYHTSAPQESPMTHRFPSAAPTLSTSSTVTTLDSTPPSIVDGPKPELFLNDDDARPPNCASWWGDPHLVTFDGLAFDCQGQGEFIVVTSLDSDFEIQARFESIPTKKIASTTKAIVVRSADENAPILQVNVHTINNRHVRACPHTFFVNGMRRDIVQNGTGTSVVSVYEVKQEKTRRNPNGYSIVFGYESGLSVELATKLSVHNGCVLNVKVCLPYGYRPNEQIIGLLGTPNEDQLDDWMTRDGTTIAAPSSSKVAGAYQYCVDNWCLQNQSESLFVYENGESSNTEFGCTALYPSSGMSGGSAPHPSLRGALPVV